MTQTDNAVPDVVCTLTTKDRAAQELEWADLAELALTRELLDNGVASTYPIELADQIEDLAAREVSCCGTWLDITHERRDGVLALKLTTTNPDGVGVIQSFSSAD